MNETTQEKLKWAEQEANRQLRIFGLDDWTFKYDNAKRRSGVCNYAKKQIGLSRHYVASENARKENILNTILHEIAHVLAGPKAKHGPKWVAKAREIGCDAQRCTRVMFGPEKKWTVKCDNGCFEIGRHRRPSVTSICVKCKGTISVTRRNDV